MNTFELLGEYGPQPCAAEEATAFAMAAMQPGTELTLLPYKPQALGPKDIRIRTTHAGMCHSDAFMISQSWMEGLIYPMVPGHEIVGVVTEYGDSVKGYNVGDRVAFGVWRGACGNTKSCRQCGTGNEHICLNRDGTYCPHFGGYSTSFQGDSFYFQHVPENLGSDAAACLMCAGLTTYQPLSQHCRPGMRVGIQGIGGLGHLGLQIASKMGCEVTAISTSASKEAEAKNFGAHNFINTKDERSCQKASNSLDFILLTGSSFNLSTYLEMVRPGGSVCAVGIPAKDDNLGLNGEFVFFGKNILSSNTGSVMMTTEMLDFCARNNIAPKTELHPFENAQAAMNMLAHGNPRSPEYRNVLELEAFQRSKGLLV